MGAITTAPLAKRLGGAGVLAITFELASPRHWASTVQLVPWAALGVVAGALVLVVARPTRGRLQVDR